MKYKLELNVNYFDKYGYKMFAYPILLSQLGFDHLKDTDQSFGILLQDRYAWVIISMKLKFLKRIDLPTTFNGNTWYSGRRGPYFRREYEIKSSDNLIVGASYSILFDFETNSIYRKKELPFISLDVKNKHLIDLKSGIRDEFELIEIAKDKVKNSHIDNLGHTNHLRYVEFIYDALTDELINEAYTYNTMELFFQKEMLLNHKYSVNYAKKDDKLIFQIINLTTNEISFTLILSNE